MYYFQFKFKNKEYIIMESVKKFKLIQDGIQGLELDWFQIFDSYY